MLNNELKELKLIESNFGKGYFSRNLNNQIIDLRLTWYIQLLSSSLIATVNLRPKQRHKHHS